MIQISESEQEHGASQERHQEHGSRGQRQFLISSCNQESGNKDSRTKTWTINDGARTAYN